MGPLKLNDKGHPQLKDPPGHAGSNNAWVTADAVHWGLVETRFLTVQEPKGSFNLSVPCRTLHYAFLSHLIHTKRSPYKWFRLPWGCDSLWVCLPMHVPVYFPPNKHYIFSLKKKILYHSSGNHLTIYIWILKYFITGSTDSTFRNLCVCIYFIYLHRVL